MGTRNRTSAGPPVPTGPQTVRTILQMVARLHADGCESLYLDAVMSPSGTHWRYEIGAMENGRWPAVDSRTVSGSIGGGPADELAWGSVTDSATVLADKFLARYPGIATAARRPNSSYAAWFREMEARTAPDGVPIFCCDYGPDHEDCFLWGGPSEFRMTMPPGYRPRD